jgi:hypothetical protein
MYHPICQGFDAADILFVGCSTIVTQLYRMCAHGDGDNRSGVEICSLIDRIIMASVVACIRDEDAFAGLYDVTDDSSSGWNTQVFST